MTNREDDELMSMEGSAPSPWIGVQRTTGTANLNGKLLCSRTERHRVRCRRMVRAVPGTGRVASRYRGRAYPSVQCGYWELGVVKAGIARLRRMEQAGLLTGSSRAGSGYWDG